nr:hypothetical protein [uncultured Psychrobacter sp.]
MNSHTRSLLFVTLLSCLLMTGCSSFGKNKETQSTNRVKPTIIQLASPSLAYLSDPAVKINNSRGMTAKRWLAIANNNYQAKRYARALRAATEALNIDESSNEARELAMLSAIKVTESNIGTYRDNALMTDKDRATFKSTLTRVTTLVNTSD